jgi:PEP-CTERM motif
MRGPVVTFWAWVIGSCLLWGGTVARADYQIYATPTQTQSVPLSYTDWGPTTPSLAGKNPFVIQQFDPTKYNQGNLTAKFYEVVVSLAYDFKNSVSMTFVNPSTMTVTAQGIMHLDLTGAGGLADVLDIVNTPTFFTQKTLNYPTDIATKIYVQPTPKDVPGTSAMGYIDATTLGHFQGTSTVQLPVFATATSGYTTSSGNGFGSSTTLASAALSITYYYYYVPEPSSMALTGIGGIGLLLAARGRGRRDAA